MLRLPPLRCPSGADGRISGAQPPEATGAKDPTSGYFSLEGCLLMPFLALAHFAQGAPPAAGAGELDRNTDIIHLVAEATVVGKIVLLILLVFSAVSWGIIFYKIWAYRRVEGQTTTFLGVFRKSAKFSEVQAV